MFESSLLIKDAKDLFFAINPEQGDLKSNRAEVFLKLDENNLLIKITAKDFTAYRSMESAIMRLLVTYYKINQLDDKNGNQF